MYGTEPAYRRYKITLRWHSRQYSGVKSPMFAVKATANRNWKLAEGREPRILQRLIRHKNSVHVPVALFSFEFRAGTRARARVCVR